MEILTYFRPQSAEDKIGEEVTKSLKRMLETMRTEVERSSSNISTARETTKNLQGTTEHYEKLSGTLEESRSLIRDLWKKNRNDMIYIFGALGVFIATAVYVILQRTPGIVWLPGKLVLRQLGNLMPKSSGKAGKFVERVVEMTEAVLSDSEDAPEMFVDRILNREEYENDDLLKQEDEHKESKHKEAKPVFTERSEPEVTVSSEESKATEEKIDNTFEEPQTATLNDNVSENIAKEPVKTQASEVKEEVATNQENTETPAQDPMILTEKASENDNKQIFTEDLTETIKKEKEFVADVAENIQKFDDVSPAAEPESSISEVQDSNEIITPNTSATDEAMSLTDEAPTATTITAHVTNEDPAITTVIENPVTVHEQVTAAETLQTPTAAVEAKDNETVSISSVTPTITKSQQSLRDPVAQTPTAAKMMTDNAYHTATESEFEGNQSAYSSETELFSGNEEKLEL